jgi:hypothetical protein
MEIVTFETRSLYTVSYTDGITQGRKTLPKIQEPPEMSKSQKGDLKQAAY